MKKQQISFSLCYLFFLSSLGRRECGEIIFPATAIRFTPAVLLFYKYLFHVYFTFVDTIIAVDDSISDFKLFLKFYSKLTFYFCFTKIKLYFTGAVFCCFFAHETTRAYSVEISK
jgi:hypothetical protein